MEKEKTTAETAGALDGETEEIKEEESLIDPQEQIRKLGKGTLTLEVPIRSRGEDVKELRYDFTNLTGWEYANAMDGAMGGANVFQITSKQALLLFAATAGKETEGIDAVDIRERMGVTDTVKAVQLATIFFFAATRAGNSRITNG
jgi:hypothetical protein